jgi:acetyl-CoA carboxylase biotin carboxyl carrier protein
MELTVDDVRAVARLLKEHNLAEIAIEDTGAGEPSRLLVRRAPQVAIAAPPRPGPATLPVPHGAGAPATHEAAPAEGSAATGEPELLTVKSTAVGLFRNAEPALQIGDRVKVGQVVGVVESLKVPNEIGALAHGEVVEILVEDGQGVEYGQPLVVLRPAS